MVHVSINTTKKLHTMALYTDDIHQSNVYEEKYDKEQAVSIVVEYVALTAMGLLPDT